MTRKRFGPRQPTVPQLPAGHAAVPIAPPAIREPWPAVEATWDGLCPLEMAGDVWEAWRARPWTVPRLRAALAAWVDQRLELRLLGEPAPVQGIYVTLRESPAQGLRLVVRGLGPVGLAGRRVDRGRWHELPLGLITAAPVGLHPLWGDRVFPEPPAVVRCRTAGCGAGVVGRFCTRCGRVAREAQTGRRQGGPLLPSLYRLWRERGLEGAAYECGCGGIVWPDGRGRFCAKCGTPVRARWLQGGFA